ncbi:MAG: energy-coupling factor transporter transmembrane component T [Protaetiibacter sp.]
MTALAPVEGDRAIHRVNPVAKLAASLVIAIPLIITIDPVSAGVALVFQALLLPWAGVGWRQFWLRTSPVWIAAPFTGLTIALYGKAGGEVLFSWGFVHVTENSLALAGAAILRVLAIGLPAVVLFCTIDPTRLADGLAQVVRLPSRFVLGALGALRLVGLFLEDWRALELARRARGVADRGRLRRFAGQAFALLVLSIRRGSKLATAMEARGFGGPTPRSWARESPFRGAEWLVILIAAGLAAAATAAAVATGSWNFIVGP